MSAITTQAGVDQLKALQSSATLDEVKAALQAAINEAEAFVANQSKDLEQRAKDFFVNIEQHLTEEGKKIYQEVKDFL